MEGYQAGISEFTDSDSIVFGISTDSVEVNTNFAESLELGFTLLSDVEGAVAGDYDVLISGRVMANRVTFVVGKDGKVVFVESGMGAINPAGASSACAGLD